MRILVREMKATHTPRRRGDHRTRVGRERSARTETRILEAALGVFADMGPDAPKIDDFVRAAGDLARHLLQPLRERRGAPRGDVGVDDARGHRVDRERDRRPRRPRAPARHRPPPLLREGAVRPGLVPLRRARVEARRHRVAARDIADGLRQRRLPRAERRGRARSPLRRHPRGADAHRRRRCAPRLRRANDRALPASARHGRAAHRCGDEARASTTRRQGDRS